MVGVQASRLKDTMFVFKNHPAFTRPSMILQKLIYFSQISVVGVPFWQLRNNLTPTVFTFVKQQVWRLNLGTT